MLGRVIMGDVMATMVDLAVRDLVTVERAGTAWAVGRGPSAETARGLAACVPYERVLVDGIAGSGGLVFEARSGPERLPDGIGAVMDTVRHELVRDAVRQGWVGRLRRGRRTSRGQEAAVGLRRFERRLRGLRDERGEEALAGRLLPFGLRFNLVARDGAPLARFAGAWVTAFGDLPGWRPVPSPRGEGSERGWYDPPLYYG